MAVGDTNVGSTPIEDRSLENLLARLRRRVGEFELDPRVVQATLNWIRLVPPTT